jgi:8-oxo-dGTP pyrophosphatase MutT (NUDIX family)
VNEKYDAQRELIARAIVVEDGAIIVNKAQNAKTGEEYFALPGGHVEPGESCVMALVREWREELNATLEVFDLCFVAESVYAGRETEDTSRHELGLYFHADLAAPLSHNGREISSPEAKKCFQWLRFDELKNSNLLPSTVKEFLLATLADEDTAHYAFSDTTRA